MEQTFEVLVCYSDDEGLSELIFTDFNSTSDIAESINVQVVIKNVPTFT